MTDTKTAHPSDAMVEAYFPEIDPLMLQIVRDFWDDGNQAGRAAGVEEAAAHCKQEAQRVTEAYPHDRDIKIEATTMRSAAREIRALLPESEGK